MTLKENELKALKIDAIEKAKQSLQRAIKGTTSPIITEVYETQIAALNDWQSQIKAGK